MTPQHCGDWKTCIFFFSVMCVFASAVLNVLCKVFLAKKKMTFSGVLTLCVLLKYCLSGLIYK